MRHAGPRAIPSQAWAARRAVSRSDDIHFARGYGCVFRFGGIAGSAGVARQTGCCGWSSRSARRCLRGELRGSQVRHSLRDAAAHRGPFVPARDFPGRSPRKIRGVERPRRDDPREIFSHRRNGFDRRSLSRSRRHRAIARTATLRRGQAPAPNYARDIAPLFRRPGRDAPGRQSRFRPSQTARPRLRPCEAGLATRTLTLTIRYAGFETHTRSKTLGEPTRLDSDIFAVFQELFRNHRDVKRKVRLLGVSLSGLTHGGEQLDLLDPERRAKLEKLTSAADRLRHRFCFRKAQFCRSPRHHESEHEPAESYLSA